MSGRENAGSSQEDDGDNRKQDLRLHVRTTKERYANTDETGEDLSPARRSENIAMDQLPATFFDRFKALLLALQ